MADNKRLTPWFPSSAKPARLGYYETRMRGHTRFRFWDGERWMYHGEMLTFPSVFNKSVNGKWRGLADDPGKEKP